VPLGHVASGVASNTQVKKKKLKKLHGSNLFRVILLMAQ